VELGALGGGFRLVADPRSSRGLLTDEIDRSSCQRRSTIPTASPRLASSVKIQTDFCKHNPAASRASALARSLSAIFQCRQSRQLQRLQPPAARVSSHRSAMRRRCVTSHAKGDRVSRFNMPGEFPVCRALDDARFNYLRGPTDASGDLLARDLFRSTTDRPMPIREARSLAEGQARWCRRSLINGAASS